MGKVASRFRRRKRKRKSSHVQHHQSLPDLRSLPHDQNIEQELSIAQQRHLSVQDISSYVEVRPSEENKRGTRRSDRFSTVPIKDIENESKKTQRKSTEDISFTSSIHTQKAQRESEKAQQRNKEDSIFTTELSTHEDEINKKIIVVAIDIGSSYSGYAWCTRADFLKDRSNIYSPMWPCGNGFYYKTPTTVLYKPDGSFQKFGFEAEEFYKKSETDMKDWYFFRNFKMVLYERKMDLNEDMTITDLQGKEMKALRVFSDCLKFFKDNFLSNFKHCSLSDDDVHWVVTVPAIWDMRAKQFMKDAAKMAGIKDVNLSLALEPEAASLYCRQVPFLTNETGNDYTITELDEGASYMVLDQGGGTIDITVHEIMPDNSLKEVYQANGGDWGGNCVNRKFEQYIENIFTKEVVDDIKFNNPTEYADILNEFERKKRGFPPENTADFEEQKSQIIFRISPVFKNTYEKVHKKELPVDAPLKFGRLYITEAKYRNFFQESVDKILEHISGLLELPSLKDVKVILAVGGYSESAILMQQICKKFPEMKIIVPKNPGLAVLKGATLFGFEPFAVKIRISRFTYGIKVEREISETASNYTKIWKDLPSGKKFATHVFEKLVTVGDHVEVGVLQPATEYEPLSRQQGKASLEFYATVDENPIEVSEEGCIKLGNLDIDLSEREHSEGCLLLQVNAGGTEISAVVTEKETGKQFKAYFCLP